MRISLPENFFVHSDNKVIRDQGEVSLPLVSCLSGCTRDLGTVPYLHEDTKWKRRLLRQVHTSDPVGMGRKSYLYTIRYIL